MLNYFNSIKVRLEPTDIGTLFSDSTFQFHKGAIRTSVRSLLLYVSMYFNSIKVRLELSIVLKVIMYALFQFHKGAIRT